MKQNIRNKITTYLNRAEELKEPQTKTPVATNTSGGSEASEDPDAVRMMQKFQGLSFPTLPLA